MVTWETTDAMVILVNDHRQLLWSRWLPCSNVHGQHRFCLQEAEPRLTKADLEFVILQWVSHPP